MAASTDWTGATPLEVLAASMPPIAGGAPHEPSDEDWAEYGRWSEALDDGRDWDREADLIHFDLYGY